MIYNFRDKENHSHLKIGKRYLFSDVLQEEKNYKIEWVEGVLDKVEKHPNSANCFVSNNRYFLYCKEIEFKSIECIEIRLIDGVHFAFYKGEKLPFLIESSIKQTPEGYSTCELKFECKMEGGQHPYEILSEYYRNQNN